MSYDDAQYDKDTIPKPEPIGHTPGPWHIDETEDSIFILSDVSDICGLIDKGTVGIEDAMANANLICAAPDLLEAAKWVLKMNEEKWQASGSNNYELLLLKRAITKATGGGK